MTVPSSVPSEALAVPSEALAFPLSSVLAGEHTAIDEGIVAFTENPLSPAAVDGLRDAVAMLRRHIYLEEARIFPGLRDQGLFAALMVMLREHGQMWQTLDRIDATLADGIDGVPLLCRELLVQLQHHNLKEERVIYPQADQRLDAQEAAHLVAFLRGGTLPDGWVCAKA